MKMKTTLSLVAAAVALFSYSVFAQEKSRAEVKEETKAANKAGIPAGEQATKTPKPQSTKARSDVKSETAAAEKAGQIPSGEQTTKTAKPASTKARSDVKAETKDATKAGIPAGEQTQKK